jgi:hypothetical protein
MGIMGTFELIAFLIYAAMIAAIVTVIFAIWRGMKAHEKLAASMKRMADTTERIEEIIKRDREPRA